MSSATSAEKLGKHVNVRNGRRNGSYWLQKNELTLRYVGLSLRTRQLGKLVSPRLPNVFESITIVGILVDFVMIMAEGGAHGAGTVFHSIYSVVKDVH